MNICTIGCGYMAFEGHGPAYRRCAGEDPQLVFSACCDIDVGKAENFKREFGFHRCYIDYLDMLVREKPDAVCLMVPPASTAGMAVEILKMGYPLLTEKPPGLDRYEAEAIKGAALSAGAPVQVAFNRRHIPLIRKMKELIDANRSDDPIYDIRYEFYRCGRRDPDFSTTAIHAIDTVRFLAGSDYESVDFRYQPVPYMDSTVINAYLDCAFESGGSGQIAILPMTGANVERVTIHMAASTYELRIPVWQGIDYPGQLIEMSGNRVRRVLTGDQVSDGNSMFEVNGFYHENKSFFEDIKNGRIPADSIDSSIQSVDISDHMRRRDSVYRKESIK